MGMSVQKKIIHIDMDCFYAAVEMRENPALKTVPLAVGGRSEQRGVVTTCNYLAREFGVRSAMPVVNALQLCPHLVVVPTRLDFYRDVSQHIREIFLRYTDVIEPLSLDEAYLDVSNSNLLHGSATLIAQHIRQTIEQELNLTASAGIAPIKFLAKIASDLNKPNGQYVIPPDQVAYFVARLPLEKIPGVGKVTIEKLHQLGLYVGSDVQQYDQRSLIHQFGKLGQSLWLRAQGIDEREVVVARERKSVGIERTFLENIMTEAECQSVVDRLYPELVMRLKKVRPELVIAKQGIKLKFADFTQTTVEHTQSQLDKGYFSTLLKEALLRQEGRSIRLLGLSVGLEPMVTTQQLTLDWE